MVFLRSTYKQGTSLKVLCKEGAQRLIPEEYKQHVRAELFGDSKLFILPMKKLIPRKKVT